MYSNEACAQIGNSAALTAISFAKNGCGSVADIKYSSPFSQPTIFSLIGRQTVASGKEVKGRALVVRLVCVATCEALYFFGAVASFAFDGENEQGLTNG